ncbi:beta-glucosidase [Mucilaginibacter rubeus]|uniref:Beta-glucosidase n=1 Tax=Mucilaginibacter rubeus TaxID=2027860 RepID=A0AAE6JHG0_9SPHI|nr:MULTISPECIES: glucoamylase family protein [Mucilaginibacter]QEM05605.1 beta-glucosidase [Mucilaginibacter rubeus]QEM18192.1 beta-glucosidase [Mucilaginibacter gossypii]QTE45274.1 Ig-like domain-containing protein [Mucilaginibacter rubeus]QTE51870.1 Ig-like domain-containing protein [Mucilaginibacter rubeus]QTE56958.1 Ig-like domain-containing protein [Mucilaginibacter rubeus]
MMNTKSNLVFGAIVLFFACGKSSKSNPDPVTPVSSSFTFSTLKVNGQASGFIYTNVNAKPAIAISFSTPLGQASVTGSVSLATKAGAAAAYSVAFQHHDSTVVITPTGLLPITQYSLKVSTALKSAKGSNLQSALEVQLTTAIDSTAKFPTITDEQLLDLVERQTLKYFYDFGHPTSGLARERNSSGDVVTSGGSGFGIMAIVAGISRGYISYADGLARIQKIVSFLNTKAQKFHGAFPHWLNGATGAIVSFSTQDNGADLVETSYLMQGLITARQYFSSANAAETQLRADINTLWNGVEWDWFRQNDQNVLYWHWSPDQGWAINMKITGWNEALIVYVLGASSTTHNIPKTVYDQGWAGNGGIKNGKTFYGVTLPLGPDRGGPLFFEHYSFLGINPTGLTDAYANYETQTKAHAMINYNYCVANPLGNGGYSANCWGLTASDIEGGYTASSPTNDVGVIAPTAAIASLPYTPTQSMAALRFFYYTLGDKLWGQYGFYDAFNLTNPWFANSYLAIDQGPIVVMTENYRSGLLWRLFMSAPEIKTGMKNLGFSGPNL